MISVSRRIFFVFLHIFYICISAVYPPNKARMNFIQYLKWSAFQGAFFGNYFVVFHNFTDVLLFLHIFACCGSHILTSFLCFYYFSHNILLLGLLFSRPWVCRGWLLESSFSDHPAAPGTLLLLLLLLLCWTTRIHFCSWAVFLKADYHYTTIFLHFYISYTNK